nr:hypothetical protein [Tanacetum cinerariifolium]
MGKWALGYDIPTKSKTKLSRMRRYSDDSAMNIIRIFRMWGQIILNFKRNALSTKLGLLKLLFLELQGSCLSLLHEVGEHPPPRRQQVKF